MGHAASLDVETIILKGPRGEEAPADVIGNAIKVLIRGIYE
jgi:hypothetical protein